MNRAGTVLQWVIVYVERFDMVVRWSYTENCEVEFDPWDMADWEHCENCGELTHEYELKFMYGDGYCGSCYDMLFDEEV